MNPHVEPAAKPFIDAIRAAPEDDPPRLVYADWLTEKGDPLGGFITLRCEQARLIGVLRHGRATPYAEDPGERALEVLAIARGSIRKEGQRRSENAFPRLRSLDLINLNNNDITPAGKKALDASKALAKAKVYLSG